MTSPDRARIHFVCEGLSDRPPQLVWKHLSDIEAWPSWVPSIQKAKLDGALLPGAGFRWRSRGVSIRSTLFEVQRPCRLSWQGSSLALRVRHQWTIEAHEHGSRIRSEEWADAFWLRPFTARLGPAMEHSVEEWLQALIRRARQEAHCDD